MSNIALVGRNEMQKTLQTSHDVALEGGIAAEGVNMSMPVQDVTNDKGLTVESVSEKGQNDVQVGGLHTIGVPDISDGDVKELILNVLRVFSDEEFEIFDEREVERVQEENGNVSQEAAMKRLSEQQKSAEMKHICELFAIDKKVSDMPDKTEAGEILTKIGKVFGSALSVVSSAAVTIISGGGGTPALVAACMGFASVIADVSGGYKAMEEKIAEALEKNQGLSQEDAARYAAFIAMGIQLAVEIASTVLSCKSPETPQQELMETINKIKSAEEVTQITDDEKIIEQATKAAEKLHGPNPTNEQVLEVLKKQEIFSEATKTAEKIYGPNPTQEQVEKLIKQVETLEKIEKFVKYGGAGGKIVMLGVDIGVKGHGMKKTDKIRQHDSELRLNQVDTEQILSVLANCGQELKDVGRRISRNAGKIQQILDSENDSKSQINEIGGGMV